jgi:hypothetical protein
MVNKVNPPPVPNIPAKWVNDPELRGFLLEWQRILYQLWERTGGYNDDIADTGKRELYPFETSFEEDDNTQNYYSIDQDIVQQYNAVTVVDNYTANAYDFINAKNCARITMPEPDTNDTVIVRNGDGSKIVIESTKNINGHRTVESTRKGTALVIQYFIDSDEWLIR